jgi:hypothetical protein
MKALALLALAVSAVAGLIALSRGWDVQTIAALAVALPLAAAALVRLRRRDPHELDVVVAIAGGLSAVVFAGVAVNASRGQGGALGVAALAAVAAVVAMVDLALLGRPRAGEPPDVLRRTSPARELFETDGVQWSLAGPGHAVSAGRASDATLALQNAWDGQREVTLRLRLPSGLEAPEELRVTLGPLMTGVLQIPIAARPGARRGGTGRAWLAVRGEDGRRVRARRYRQIPGPPSATAQGIGLVLALLNPLHLLFSLSDRGVPLRIQLATGSARGPEAPRPLRARWLPDGKSADETRAAQAAARFRRG